MGFNKVEVFEYEGKLYRTEEEAKRAEMYSCLSEIFNGMDAYDIINSLSSDELFRNGVVSILTQ